MKKDDGEKDVDGIKVKEDNAQKRNHGGERIQKNEEKEGKGENEEVEWERMEEKEVVTGWRNVC